MIMSFRFRLYPNKEQANFFDTNMSHSRFVYNTFLGMHLKKYREEGKGLGKYDLSKQIPTLKEKYPFLKKDDNCTFVQESRNVERNFKTFFRGDAGFPKFKRKKNNINRYFPRYDRITVKGNKVRIPKLGWVRCKNSHNINQYKFLRATLFKTKTGKYILSLMTNYEEKETIRREDVTNDKKIGIDVGYRTFLTFNDGTKIESPLFLTHKLSLLRIRQKSLSRKPRGSNNHEKARIKVAKLYEHTTNQKIDFINKVTTKLVRDYDEIHVEDIKVSSFKTKYKSINRKMLDVGLSYFFRQLEYKCEREGKNLVKASKDFPSSQMCSNCGNINPAVRNITIREWDCPVCGVHHDRDINAAINLYNYAS